jgi:ribose transport system substrate-binding protein
MSSIKDVAKLAGVSISTVSRVINQNIPVDDDTRKKVEAAIRKLQYQPNLLARRLRQQGNRSREIDVAPYARYEKYCECARTRSPYPGSPGKGKRLGVASIFGAQPFCIEMVQSILSQAGLAGFHPSDLLFMDNQYDPDIALQNAENLLAYKPHLFIEHQADVKVNNIIAAKFGNAGIPLIAVDVPVPGAPFMGVNNWQVATLGGTYMAQLIRDKWGGWETVDLVVLLQNPEGGEVTMLRSEGFANALAEAFGSQVENKLVRTDGGMGNTEQAKVAMRSVLREHPTARRIAVTSINEETMAGVIAALQEAQRWQRADIIVITLGVDDLGKIQLREGLSDAGVAFFPEKYGEYLIPAACAILEGAPVPSHLYIENAIITNANIDQFYSQK